METRLNSNVEKLQQVWKVGTLLEAKDFTDPSVPALQGNVTGQVCDAAT